MKIRLLGGKIAVAALLAASVFAAKPALAGEKHAALAYSEAKHRYGWSKDKATKEEAEQNAVKACGEACTVRLTFSSGCGAYAEGAKNEHYGWATGKDLEDTEKRALEECNKRPGAQHCTIRVQACN